MDRKGYAPMIPLLALLTSHPVLLRGAVSLSLSLRNIVADRTDIQRLDYFWLLNSCLLDRPSGRKLFRLRQW
jgi:hypothetical protein